MTPEQAKLEAINILARCQDPKYPCKFNHHAIVDEIAKLLCPELIKNNQSVSQSMSVPGGASTELNLEISNSGSTTETKGSLESGSSSNPDSSSQSTTGTKENPMGLSIGSLTTE